MCIFAMNSLYAFMNSRSKKEVDYRKALTELIAIEGDEAGENSRKYINWINKYACNKEFQTIYNAPNSDLHGDKNSLRIMDMASDLFEYDNKLKAELARKKEITYLDSSLNVGDGDILCVRLNNIYSAKTELKAIAELYLFMIGGSLTIRPYACKGYPLLPEIVSRDLSSLIDLKEISSIYDINFLLPSDYPKSNLDSVSNIDDFFFSDEMLKEHENDFNKYKEHFNVIEDFKIDDTLRIKRDDPFGEICFQLAFQVISQYIKKCSSFFSYNELKPDQEFLFDRNLNKLRTRTAEEILQDCTCSIGIYNLHKTLATAILDSHIFTCEYCGKPFIPRRSDAKTCSYTCRNAMSLKKQHYREFQEEQRQPHAEV